MSNNYFYDYIIIRVVPKVEREEFINVGVILSCKEKKFLKARIHLDENRLKLLNKEIDIDTIKSHLSAFEDISAGSENAGPIAKLSQMERFHWLSSPKSTIIQTSPVHSGYCKEPSETLDHLLKTMVK